MRNTTKTFYRKADVSSKEAIDGLMKNYPKAEVVSFETKNADRNEARRANARPNDRIYVATIKVSEFPPSEDKEEPKEDAPEESSEPKEDSGESEDSGLGDIAPEPEFGGDEGGLGEEESMDPAEETVHLLKQILDELKGGGMGGPEEELGPGGPEDSLVLPDIGAPAPGEALPPPVEEKAPLGMGGPAMASVTLIRDDVTENVGNKEIIAEAASRWPTHKVARIKRRGEIVLNGEKVNLPAKQLAVVTLVKK